MRSLSATLSLTAMLCLLLLGSAKAQDHAHEPEPSLIEVDDDGRIAGNGERDIDGRRRSGEPATAEEHSEEETGDEHGAGGHGAGSGDGDGGHGADRASQAAHWTDHHVFSHAWTDFHYWHLPGLEPIPLMPWYKAPEKPTKDNYKPLLNLHSLMMFLAALVLIVLFIVLYKHGSMVPRGRLTNFLEVMSKFVRDEICVPNMGEHEGHRFAPLLCTFFFFILAMNLMGLIPIFSTATGNFSVTTGLATLIFLVMTLGAMVIRNPVNWFKSFVPHGVPWPVLLLITPLELLGLLIKTFALAVRLFANMMAGHIVLFSFIGLMAVFGWAAAPAIVLAVGVYALELFVAFLQAYVFTILSAIFIGHIVHPHH